jgi:xanthine dehydrogenase molybdenum-binding subunit
MNAPVNPQQKPVTLVVNGQETTFDPRADETLLESLRERCELISPKNGCAPQAQCGCCAVHVGGKPMLSCALPVSRAGGKDVTTAEGLDPELRQQIAACFVQSGGVQCGFCIPGIVMRAVHLLERNPDATRDDIAKGLKAHLCRCTGYTQILDAIEMLGRVRRGEPMPEPSSEAGVGAPLARYRGQEFVLGDFKYVDDITIAQAHFAAMRFSDHPRAELRGLDTSVAAALPGVQRIITAEDVPGERYVGLITQDWPVLVAIGEETRCMGDILAIVVATDQNTARAAAEQIVVDYDVREPVTSPQAGLQPDAPRVHPGGNLLSESSILRGDATTALSQSTHVVKGRYATQFIEHMFLEPESCIAIPSETDDGTPALKVLSQGQGVFDDQRQISSVLGWDRERVQVELVSNGGAFGGKEDMSIQAQVALAAALCNHPVKATLTRDESFRLHPKRHPVEVDLEVGCDDQGHLTALHARIIGDKGAYASVGAKVLERAAGHATGPYRFPNVDIHAQAVYTNNPPCGAMRGFGANQSAFAIESCLNRLAEKVGIDAWEMRWRNILDQGDHFCTGQQLDKPFGLRKTLLAVKDQFKAARYAGIACGIKNVGIGNGMPDVGKAVIKIEAADRAVIRTGFTEMGQGLFTICIQTACEETGLRPDLFEATTDTTAAVDCGQTTASRGTVLGAVAVQRAARALKADLDRGQRLEDLVGREYTGDYACTYTSKLGADVENPKTHLTYGFATQIVILDDDGLLKKVVAAHDVGRAMNPTLLEGQMQGSIHMGLGYALTEDFKVEGGHIQSKDVMSLGVLRAHHMPEVEVILIEEPDPETAYGARGVGEIGLVPTAPAVAAALEAFDGIHRTRLPMDDSPAAKAILGKRRR